MRQFDWANLSSRPIAHGNFRPDGLEVHLGAAEHPALAMRQLMLVLAPALAEAFEAAVQERRNLASMPPQVSGAEAPGVLAAEEALSVLVQRRPHSLRFQHSLAQPTK